MIGLFLAAVTLGLLVWAVQMIGGAVQDRMADSPKAPPARERDFLSECCDGRGRGTDTCPYKLWRDR